MQKLEIKGGKRISGTIVISGSKNATLPILASTILTKKKIIITNVPIVKDVETMVDLLSAIGSKIKFNKKAKKIEIINVNTAKKDELIFLPYVGPVTAERIIRFREDFGVFKSIDDLTRVKGIGPKTLDKLRKYVTI